MARMARGAGRERARGARLDHADHRHLALGRERRQGRGRGRVAGDEHHADPVAQQKALARQGVSLDRARALGAIGDPGRIAEIDDIALGQGRPQRTHHGQTADAGVENADAPFTGIHGPLPLARRERVVEPKRLTR